MTTRIFKSTFGRILLACGLSSSMRPFSRAAVPSSDSLTAAVIGATGAVGKEVVSHLINRDGWEKVIVINRRSLQYKSSKIEQHVIAMETEQLKRKCATALQDADVLFITMGVGAASKVTEDVLRKVDVDLPTACSEGALKAGVKHVSILTAIGADADAKPSTGVEAGLISAALHVVTWVLPKTRAGGPLYNQCKGLVERNIGALEFPWGMSAFRPAALLGTPHTPGIIAMISPTLDSIVPVKYKSSNINTVAAAMIHEAEQRAETQKGGNRIFEGERLHNIYGDVPFEHGTTHGDEL